MRCVARSHRSGHRDLDEHVEYGRTVVPPLTVSLATMNDAADDSSNGPASPLTATERSIADLWNEVLRSEAPPTLTDNFFAIGGDSMSMITLEFRIQEELGVDLAPGAILSAPTLRELSSLVDSLMHPSSKAPATAARAHAPHR